MRTEAEFIEKRSRI